MIKRTLVILALTVLGIGGVAYANDDQGSGDRAWAQVDPNGGSPVLVLTKNFVAVSSPITGVYCLRAASWVNLAHSAPVASQEANLSSTIGLVTPRRVGARNSSCPAGELQVDTWASNSDPSSPTLVNTVGFDLVVP